MQVQTIVDASVLAMLGVSVKVMSEEAPVDWVLTVMTPVVPAIATPETYLLPENE